jgi:hypothetical protein
MFFDKYLGDMLYAVLFYFIIALIKPNFSLWKIAIMSMIILTVIEVFQITHIPLSFRLSKSVVYKVIGILLGTEFSFYDLFAYYLGISASYIYHTLCNW